jgi:DNA-binding transcriptional MerR regulator
MQDASRETAIYSIGAVSRMLGIPVATVRSWEERYGVIQPVRTAGGHRLYSRRQVDDLRFIRSSIDDGLSPADAHRLLAERIAPPDSPSAEPATRQRLLILLAERDPYAAELAEFFLRTDGFDVEVVFDASEAEQRFASLEPDLTVVEWLISGGAGAELCRLLKIRVPAPIVVISPLALHELALKAGADAFVRKPLDPTTFVSTVRELVAQRPQTGLPAVADAGVSV